MPDLLDFGKELAARSDQSLAKVPRAERYRRVMLSSKIRTLHNQLQRESEDRSRILAAKLESFLQVSGKNPDVLIDRLTLASANDIDALEILDMLGEDKTGMFAVYQAGSAPGAAQEAAEDEAEDLEPDPEPAPPADDAGAADLAAKIAAMPEEQRRALAAILQP